MRKDLSPQLIVDEESTCATAVMCGEWCQAITKRVRECKSALAGNEDSHAHTLESL